MSTMVKMTKKVIHDGYQWMVFSEHFDHQVKMLYQASQNMLTKLESFSNVNGSFSGSSSHTSQGWLSATHTHGHMQGSHNSSGKTVTPCDYLEVELSTAAKISEWADLWDRSEGVRHNAKVFKTLVKDGHEVDLESLLKCMNPYSGVVDSLNNMTRRWRRYEEGSPANHNILMWYLHLMDDFSSFDFSIMDKFAETYEGKDHLRYTIPHKYKLYSVHINMVSGIYDINLRSNTMSAQEFKFECFGAQECKKIIQKFVFRTIPTLLGLGLKFEIFSENDEIWLDYLRRKV